MSLNSKECSLFNFFRRRTKKPISLEFRLIRLLYEFRWRERLLREFGWENLKSKLNYQNIPGYHGRGLGENFMLFGGMPSMPGNGNISIGDKVEIHAIVTFFTGRGEYNEPDLRIDNSTTIGAML